MVVTFNWAQYAIAAFGTLGDEEDGILVGFDGRFDTCYPREVVDMHFDFVLGWDHPRFRGLDSPPFDAQRVLEYGQPDLVLLCRQQPHSVQVMAQNQDRWVLLYQDQIAQLWGRKDRYDDSGSQQYIPLAARPITDEAQEGVVPWPALPQPSTTSAVLATNR
jgi:hypothetical protein